MSSTPSDSLEPGNINSNNSSFSSDVFKFRTEELKQSLILWRKVLLPLNNLLEWKHKYDPLVIFGTLTFIFICIHQLNPSVLTLLSGIVLIIILIDLLAPVGIGFVNKNEDWTSVKEEKYSRLCEHLAFFEQHVKHKYQSILKMRRERPKMYLIIGVIFLSFLAICGQRFDNLFLAYLIILVICLIPGLRNQQYIPIIHQYFSNKSKDE